MFDIFTKEPMEVYLLEFTIRTERGTFYKRHRRHFSPKDYFAIHPEDWAPSDAAEIVREGFRAGDKWYSPNIIKSVSWTVTKEEGGA